MRFHRAAVFVCAGLIASLGSAAFAQNFVKPGDTVSIPFPVENAVDSGDTINSMKVVVTGGSAFVTSPTDSATQSLALGEVKTFTPTFVVGNVLDGSYTVTLKQVSTDVGLDPDPDDPASDTSVPVSVDRTPPDVQAFDAQGNNIAGEVTNSGVIVVQAEDPVPGSGAYRFSIQGPTAFPDTIFSGGDAVAAGEVAQVTYADLVDGFYTVTVFDQAGNETSVFFKVDRKAPSVSLGDENGPIPADHSVTRAHSVVLTADDGAGGSGIAKMTLTGHDDVLFDGEQIAEVTFTDLDEGLYEGKVTDKAGNEIAVTVAVDRTPPAVQAFDDQGNNISGGAPNSNVVVIRAVDPTPGSGAYRFSIHGPTEFEDTIFSGADAVAAGGMAEVTYANLADGLYTVTVFDQAGNTTSLQFTLALFGPTTVAWSGEPVPRYPDWDGVNIDAITYSYARHQSNTLATAPWINGSRGVKLHADRFETMDVFSPGGALILHAPGDGVATATAVIAGLPNASGYLMTLDQGTTSEQKVYFNQDSVIPSETISNAVRNGDGSVTVTGTAVAGPSGVQKICFEPSHICSNGGGAAYWPFTLTLPYLCGSNVIEVSNVAGTKGLDGYVNGGCGFSFDANGIPVMNIYGGVSWVSPPPYTPPAGTLNIGFTYANAYVALMDVQGSEMIAMADPPVQLPASYYTLTSSEAWTIQVSHNYSGPGYVDLAFKEHPSPGGHALGQSADQARLLAIGVDGSVTDVSHSVSLGTRISRGTLTGASLYTVGVTSQVATMFLDMTPPVSRISGIGPMLEGRDGGVFIATDTRIQLNSTEFGNDGYVSGSSHTFYAVDQAFTDTTATPGIVYDYSVPLTMTPGTHTFWYYSVDAAGNVEAVRTARVTATAGMSSGTTAPGAPSAVARASTTVELAWTAGTNPPGTVYAVKVATSCGSSASWSVGTDTPSIVVSDLAPGTSYYFSACTYGLGLLGLPDCSVPVEVATGLGGREDSPPSRIGCNGPPETAASATSVTRVSSTSAVLAWPAGGNPPGISYFVDYATSPVSSPCGVEPGSFFGFQGVIGETSEIGGLAPASGYRFRVCNASLGAAGCATPVAVVTRQAGELELTSPAFLTCSTITVSGSTQAAFNDAAGLGIGADGQGQLWSVFRAGGTLGFARASAAGAMLSSATLQDGTPDSWAVFFDAQGRAYAVGSADGATTQASDVAVYKASPAGDAVESRILFDSGYANNDMVFNAAAPGWIVGAAQTSGPADLNANGDFSFSMALWRFDSALGTIQLSTTYARAGFDFGAALGVDADGSVWIAGYSMRPQAPAAGSFDLALWHYAADGRTLLGGPFLRPGYLNDINGDLAARVFVSSQSVYVAASKDNALGGTDMAFVRFDKSSGMPTAESAWRPADNSQANPVAMLPQGSDILIVGTIGSSTTQTALWRYGYDGALRGVTTAGAGGARGAALLEDQLWLSVDGSSAPYRVLSETTAPGGLIDLLPPRTTVSVGYPSFDAGTTTYVTNAALLGLTVADDKLSLGDGLGVGATQTFYATDGGAYALFAASFSLVAEGTHTVSFFSIDREGNTEAAQTRALAVDITAPTIDLVAAGAVFELVAEDPVSGGAASGLGQVVYVVDVDPASCDNVDSDTAAPRGTCANPNYGGPFTLNPGTHTVAFVAADNVGNGQDTVYTSTVSVSSSYAFTPSMGPIGVPFSITGAGFGAYSGSNTRVKFGTAAAPLSVWNDTTISGTIPGLSTGAYAVTIERQNVSSVTVVSAGVFTATGLSSATLSVSSGPIGLPFAFTGAGFGPYAGTLTRVLVGGTTASLSVWNDAQISGTIPGVTPGAKTIVIQRATGDGGLSTSVDFAFQVTVPSVTLVIPSSGPIGAAFTLSGQSFGPYAGALTQVLIGGATAPLSVWNDATIAGIVPGALMPGVYPLIVERRTSDGGLSQSNTAYLQVLGLALSSLSPSSGPIGVPFTITGTGFGAYGGTYTRVKFGASVAALSLWNDTTIAGTIPALDTGAWTVSVERQQGADVAMSNISSFTVLALSVSSVTPATGPIGTAFTIKGSGFGPYAGTNTRALIGGVAAALSLWNDTTITGTIPNLPSGAQPVWLERSAGSGVSSSATSYFNVTTPALATLSPSSAPIGAPFTITGTSFGAYAGANTRVKFGGVAAPLSVWNDTTISGTVPGALAPGAVEVVIERAAGTGLTSSATQAFLVLVPAISTISPAFGPTGTVVTLTGSGFGPYSGALTLVLVGGSTVPLSVWNDSMIRWTVPASLADGVYPVVIRRSPAGGTVDSASATFTVGTGISGASFGFTAPLSLAATPDSHFEGDMSLSSATGGRIDTPAKAAVEIPANAMDADTEITLKRAHGDGLRARAASQINKLAAGEPIEFGPEGTRFAAPVTIELPYDPALTADETKIAIHYYNPLRREWEELPSEVDRARHVVKAKTDHFSIYQPMGLAPMTTAQDEFYFRDAYAFPNPSRGNALVTFRIQPGLAEAVEVRVYDLSGRKVHSSSDFRFSVWDDGNGKGNQNTYDHGWDVSGVGSGVYTYVIAASRGGQKPIVKSGKVGVIK